MGGLAVLFFIVLYLVIAFTVIKKVKASRYKFLALVLMVLIPSGDAVLGRLYLKHLCAEEGGLKVYRVAEHVEGFMDATFTNGDGFWVKEHGYKYSEYAPVNGRVIRYSKLNGQIVREEDVIPKSQYRIRIENIGLKDVYGRSIHTVEIADGKEVLATLTAIAFKGGWAERFLAQFSDAGIGNVAFCEDTLPEKNWGNHVQLIVRTLKH